MNSTKRNLGVLLGAGIVAIVTALSGGVASADPVPGQPPVRPLQGVGSDTTTPIMNALANDATALAIGGVRQVASWNATGPAFDTGKPGPGPFAGPNGCGFNATGGAAPVRPDGSGAGRAALIQALQTAGPTALDRCLQFSRSSSLDQSAAAVQLTYLPFASEAISFAVNRVSNVPRNLTLDQLRQIYNCQIAGFRPMLPQAGSGTRSFWLSLMYPGGTPNPLPSCVQNGVDENGNAIQEHNGTQVNNIELVPFSVAQWASQQAGVITPDVRGQTVVGQINSTNPFADNFAVQRDLYNVIPTSQEGVAPWSTVFVGGGSLICGPAANAIKSRFFLRTSVAPCGSALRTA